jgi:hypothetical protein
MKICSRYGSVLLSAREQSAIVMIYIYTGTYFVLTIEKEHGERAQQLRQHILTG